MYIMARGADHLPRCSAVELDLGVALAAGVFQPVERQLGANTTAGA